ncbi:roadblock/LC7 domain-containing protein [Acinetobacter sp. C26M]|uniref:roadblock/LC7 domain-containing protein n=1 Tax=unclassified Acinetobacter TaxID=196816 RepID=UPI0014209432|nr:MULTISPECIES: roadblock/LC7 domain-containing protein [unclassified Acinetobacter]NIE97502.1 roadblock/LC7 domain-containing protein [Acinetobacter sp. Tr-809]USA46085.1 roadblock/LC7 domain-containing protein [Acinetobacter sp. C26M]USA49569.1 roadblock/LC7 domain-containing protein [Acinetobacter sp. C26G]
MFSIPSQQRTAPKELIQFAKAQANDVLTNIRGVDYIMLCSTDGFELASIYKKNPYNSTKLAAVSSSILAMVTAFLNEIQLTGCQSITLDAENGKAILTSIPAPHHPMVMVTLSNKDVLLGQLLYSLKQASSAIVDADQA